MISMIVLFLMFSPTSLVAGDRIYTNEDLKQYESEKRGPSFSITPGKAHSDDELMKRGDTPESIIRSSDFNPSFDALQQYIKQKLKDTKVSEYHVYLRPLASGMTQEQVKQMWGTKILGARHEESNDKAWTVDSRDYEIGISLYFENNKLKGWRTFDESKHPSGQRSKEEEVLVSLSGCPTLQDSLDAKSGNDGSATFWVLRHGRTTKEICETIGRGCNSCRVLGER
ncbi:MAG: hypothetical protein AMK74_02915 [Nitrospira bacterium SM23_35]|nr:MAG: hypothetical protein AMK74_02915 [Nitrospira bacterium SM23_35]